MNSAKTTGRPLGWELLALMGDYAPSHSDTAAGDPQSRDSVRWPRPGRAWQWQSRVAWPGHGAAITAYIRSPLQGPHTRAVTGEQDRTVPPVTPHRDNAPTFPGDSTPKTANPASFPLHRGWERLLCLSHPKSP